MNGKVRKRELQSAACVCRVCYVLQPQLAQPETRKRPAVDPHTVELTCPRRSPATRGPLHQHDVPKVRWCLARSMGGVGPE